MVATIIGTNVMVGRVFASGSSSNWMVGVRGVTAYDDAFAKSWKGAEEKQYLKQDEIHIGKTRVSPKNETQTVTAANQQSECSNACKCFSVSGHVQVVENIVQS